MKNWTTEHPPLDTPVLLYYMKGKKGPFFTEGHLTDDAERLGRRHKSADFWRNLGRGLTYYDYADRQLQSLTAKKSKNKVLGWLPIPDVNLKEYNL